jgi:hypothetical protein
MSSVPPAAAAKIGRIIVTVYKTWPVVLAMAGSAWGTYSWLQMQLDTRIEAQTAPAIAEALAAERKQTAARFDAQYRAFERLQLRLKKSQDDLQRLYWLYVGDVAAARQRNRRLRDLAAARARIAFDEQLRKGKSLQDAMSAVLATSP